MFSLHKLVWNGDFYYMVGGFEKEQKIGVFRFDQILNRLEILEDDAIPFQEGFNFNRYLQSSFRVFCTETTLTTRTKYPSGDALVKMGILSTR